MNFSWTQASLITLGLTLTALTLWWFERKNRETLYLPILALLQPERATRRRLQVSPPPWLAYIFFAGASLLLTALAFKPFQTKLVPTPSTSNQNLLLVIDQSPSLSAFVNEDEYKSYLLTLVKKLSLAGKSVHIFFNDGKLTNIPSTLIEEKLPQILENLAFFGGNSLQLADLWPSLAQTDSFESAQILIVSDRDDFFWKGFSREAQESANIFRLKPYGKSETGHNFYIESALFRQEKRIKGAFRPVVGKLARADIGDSLPSTVDLEVSLQQEGKQFGFENVRFGEDVSNLHIEIIPGKDFKYSEPSELILKSAADPQHDVLLLDNTYFVRPASESLKIRVVSETQSESLIKSSLYAFGESWSSLSHSVKYSTPAVYEASSFVFEDLVVLVESLGSFAQHCKNIAQKSNSARVWVVPSDTTQNFKNICDCASHFLEPKSPVAFQAKFCSSHLGTADFASTLASLGAKIYGGNIDEENSGLSYEFNINNTKDGAPPAKSGPLPTRSVTFWKFPLDPTPLLSHVKIFRLVQSFALNWSLKAPDSHSISSNDKNVALSESRFILASEENLVPELNFDEDASFNSSSDLTSLLSERRVEVADFHFLNYLALAAALWMILESFVLFLTTRSPPKKVAA